MFADVCPALGHFFRIRRIHLVDHRDMRHEQVGFARVVEQFMSYPVRIEQNDMNIRLIKGRIIVAAVPYNHVRLFFCGFKDFAVVNAGIYHNSLVDQRFVFFPFFQGALMGSKIPVGRKPLNLLLSQISVRHGMTNRHNLPAHFTQNGAYLAGGLGLSAPGSHGTDGNNGFPRFQHGIGGSDQDEIGAFGHGDGCLVHDLDMGDITV